MPKALVSILKNNNYRVFSENEKNRRCTFYQKYQVAFLTKLVHKHRGINLCAMQGSSLKNVSSIKTPMKRKSEGHFKQDVGSS